MNTAYATLLLIATAVYMLLSTMLVFVFVAIKNLFIYLSTNYTKLLTLSMSGGGKITFFPSVSKNDPHEILTHTENFLTFG